MAGQPAPDDPARDQAPVSKGAPTALVVDDSDLLRTLVSRILGSGGLAVTEARSVAEALRLDPSRYDVLIVDVRLGDGSGTDLIGELRATDPTVAGRAVMLSGAPAIDPLPTSVPVIAKPFTADELLTAVRSLIPAPAPTLAPAEASPRAGPGPDDPA